MRKPTDAEIADTFRKIAFALNLHRRITMNNSAVVEILNRIDSYVMAHSDCNGERTEAEIRKNVASAFWTHLARTAPPELPKRGRKKNAESSADSTAASADK